MSKVYYASLFSIAVAIGTLVYYLNSPLQTANASIALKPEDKTNPTSLATDSVELFVTRLVFIKAK